MPQQFRRHCDWLVGAETTHIRWLEKDVGGGGGGGGDLCLDGAYLYFLIFTHFATATSKRPTTTSMMPDLIFKPQTAWMLEPALSFGRHHLSGSALASH
mmetsp:Transcript_40599/g.67424  ORF Transcript_40599/g.67424 Transcript_40599/m.67424 type:complete len:99 (-) Transcript_40599:1312-1608(-)